VGGVLVMLAFVGIIAAIAVPNLLASRRAANEASAIANLRQLASAEMTYNALEGEGYADLNELARRQLITSNLAGRELSGYKFEVKVTDEDFEATATPVSYGSTGTRSFYVSTEGIIRVADRRGLKARADDPPLIANLREKEVIIDPGGRVSWPGKQ
ncbi:MAG TPA: type II secretion system protein, partial [Pyrinomonadaceae bacterium]